MADHNKPTTSSLYASFISELDARLDDLAMANDPARTSVTNPATHTVRWSSAVNKWHRWDGSAWVDLSSGFAIPIVGGSVNNSPIGAVTPSTGAFTTLSATGKISTSLAGSASAPSLSVGSVTDGLFASAGGVGIASGGVRRAHFGVGWNIIGEVSASNTTFLGLRGESVSTASYASGLYTGVTFRTDGVKCVTAYGNQIDTTLADDGSVRAFSAVQGLRVFAPDTSAMTAGSTVTNYYGYVHDSMPDTKILSAYAYHSSIAKVAGVARWNFYAAGSAPNYFAGDTTFGGSINKTPTRSIAAAGSTIVLTTSTNTLLYDNAATAAALTITLPSANLVNGQEISIATRSAITALTINGGTIYGAPTTLAAGGFCTFIYSSTGAAWFRKG